MVSDVICENVWSHVLVYYFSKKFLLIINCHATEIFLRRANKYDLRKTIAEVNDYEEQAWNKMASSKEHFIKIDLEGMNGLVKSTWTISSMKYSANVSLVTWLTEDFTNSRKFHIQLEPRFWQNESSLMPISTKLLTIS